MIFQYILHQTGPVSVCLIFRMCVFFFSVHDRRNTDFLSQKLLNCKWDVFLKSVSCCYFVIGVTSGGTLSGFMFLKNWVTQRPFHSWATQSVWKELTPFKKWLTVWIQIKLVAFKSQSLCKKKKKHCLLSDDNLEDEIMFFKYGRFFFLRSTVSNRPGVLALMAHEKETNYQELMPIIITLSPRLRPHMKNSHRSC